MNAYEEAVKNLNDQTTTKVNTEQFECALKVTSIRLKELEKQTQDVLLTDKQGDFCWVSGKDATKVDRSAAYMLRHIAKNIVANGYAKKCEIQVAYAIGMEQPMSVFVDTFGTNTISEDDIIDIINRNFNLTPRGIIEYLNLREPIFTKTTNYGHFGKTELPWERVITLK